MVDENAGSRVVGIAGVGSPVFVGDRRFVRSSAVKRWTSRLVHVLLLMRMVLEHRRPLELMLAWMIYRPHAAKISVGLRRNVKAEIVCWNAIFWAWVVKHARET